VSVEAESRRGRGEPRAKRRPEPATDVKSGASVPPDVPLPRYSDHERNLSTTRSSSTFPTMSPERIASMFAYPTPNVRGST